MHRATRLPPILLAFAASITAFAQTAPAPNTSALINEQLDKQVKLNLQTTLFDGLRKIYEMTGVPIEAAQGVWDALPYGTDTNFKATIENVTLRDALTAITHKLGLTFTLRDEAIEIEPLPALRRVGRRSTVSELEALDLLASNQLKLNTDRPTVKQLVDAVDQKLLDLKSPFAVEFRPGEAVKGEAPVSVPRNATMLDALEALAKDTNATWYPWGRSIVVVPKEDQVRTQLGKTITSRWDGVDVSQVLLELSQRAGVNFDIEPGAIQRIPTESRKIRLLSIDNATIKQALDTVAGVTGLAWNVNDKGVYVWNPSSASATGTREPVIGIIPLDNGFQALVTANQVPPDVREYVNFKLQKEWAKFRQQMKEEKFTPPASQPATRPTAGKKEDL